jgi:ATP-dependent DNA helicase RecG
MQRLLQGEVGSGKTLVALRAMLAVVEAGGQAVLLAPTEVLAAQHHRSLSAALGPLGRAGTLDGDPDGTRVTLLTGSAPTAVRRKALLDIVTGEAGIVVGTHALLSDTVEFHDLAMVVVDEQHRFGVEQRDALRARGVGVHVLVMTATPIPRTVAMTVFGDLDTSVLDELPSGRRPVTTHVVGLSERPAWAQRIWQRVREEVDGGHQAFVVCGRIGAGEEEGVLAEAEADLLGEDGARRPPAASVLDTMDLLAQQPALAGCRVAMLHGRMSGEDKDAVMQEVVRGRVDVLVATTVIEVGVDVPNATVMVVLDADRFGVSQLHQLRGRIGRGGHPASACSSPGCRPGRRRASGSTRSPRPATASSSRGSTCAAGARGTCSAPPSPVPGPRCGCCAWSTTSRSSPPRGPRPRPSSPRTRRSSGTPSWGRPSRSPWPAAARRGWRVAEQDGPAPPPGSWLPSGSRSGA